MSNPMRLTFFGGAGGTDVVAMSVSHFLGRDRVRNRPRVNRQATVVADAFQFFHVIGVRCEPEQGGHLPVAVLVNYVHAALPPAEVLHLLAVRKRTETAANGPHDVVVL